MRASISLAIAILCLGLASTLLASCGGAAACGDRLGVALEPGEPGDYVIEGLARSWPLEDSFRCTLTAREDAGVLLHRPGDCEGRVGLYTEGRGNEEAGEHLMLDFWGAPEEVSWSLSWTAPTALSAGPEQRAGTLAPGYEGEPGCSEGSGTIP